MKQSDFDKLIADKLARENFKKKRYFYIKELDKEIYGTIGFIVKKQKSPEALYINPVIGIFNKPVETIFCKITGYQSIKTFQPTISCPISYLMSQDKYFEWEYSEQSFFISLSLRPKPHPFYVQKGIMVLP